MVRAGRDRRHGDSIGTVGVRAVDALRQSYFSLRQPMDPIAVVGAALDYRFVPFRDLWTARSSRMVGVSLQTAESARVLCRRGTVSRRALSSDVGARATGRGRMARASTTPQSNAIGRFRGRFGLARRRPVRDHLVRPVDCAAFDLSLSRAARSADRRADRRASGKTVPTSFRYRCGSARGGDADRDYALCQLGPHRLWRSLVRGEDADAARGAECDSPDNDRRSSVLYHSHAASVVALPGGLEYDCQSMGAAHEAPRHGAHHRPRPSGPTVSTYPSADGREGSARDLSCGTNDAVRGHRHQHANEPTRALPPGSPAVERVARSPRTFAAVSLAARRTRRG